MFSGTACQFGIVSTFLQKIQAVMFLAWRIVVVVCFIRGDRGGYEKSCAISLCLKQPDSYLDLSPFLTRFVGSSTKPRVTVPVYVTEVSVVQWDFIFHFFFLCWQHMNRHLQQVCIHVQVCVMQCIHRKKQDGHPRLSLHLMKGWSCSSCPSFWSVLQQCSGIHSASVASTVVCKRVLSQLEWDGSELPPFTISGVRAISLNEI